MPRYYDTDTNTLLEGDLALAVIEAVKAVNDAHHTEMRKPGTTIFPDPHRVKAEIIEAKRQAIAKWKAENPGADNNV